MATGPEHYLEGERLLRLASTPPELEGQVEMWLEERHVLIESAKCHFMAAQAAALAASTQSQVFTYLPSWRDACARTEGGGVS